MNKPFTKSILIISAIMFSSQVINAQITLLNDYKNYNSATIGVFQGITYREAGFSALTPIAGDGKEFWTISDRGVNIDCASANATAIPMGTVGCTPTFDKMFAFPSYAPKIHRIRVNGDSIQILKTIVMKRPGGASGATGLLNPVGLGSTATEVASTNTVANCVNFAANTAAKDIWGIDSEGIALDQNGDFIISEEGGPSIWKISPRTGEVITRYTPYGNLASAQSQDIAIDTVFKYRKNNRGFECLAITPNGKIYAIIQSPLFYPSQAVGEGTQVHRMIEIDPTTNTTRVFAYLNDGIIGASGANQIRLKDWKLGEMVAINNTEFLVIEAAARGTTDIKRIYKINIAGATPITSGLYGGLTVEALVNIAGLSGKGITPVTKTLFMDLLANSWPSSLEKAEGLAIINDSTIALCNDNDYAQTCPAADGVAIPTSIMSHVLIYGLKGSNKLSGYMPLVINSGSPTSLEDNQNDLSSVSIYPNPAENMVTVNLKLEKESVLNVQVLDINGKEVINHSEKVFTQGENTLSFDISEFQNGVYFIKLSDTTSSTTKKLVILH